MRHDGRERVSGVRVRDADLRDLIGAPYKPRGRGDGGWDCWGLAVEVARRLGAELPDVPYNGADGRGAAAAKVREAALRRGAPVEKIDRLERWCLLDVAWDGRTSAHVAVYLGGGKMLHAAEGLGVCVEDAGRYSKLIKGMYRIRRCLQK